MKKYDGIVPIILFPNTSTIEKENILKENPPNDRRKSKIARVRRSSRLFRQQSEPLSDQTNHLGTVFQDVEIQDKRKSRRSINFSNNENF